MKEYHYFVSYQYINNSDSGFGQANLLLKKPITEPEQILELQSYIVNAGEFSNVIIINFQLLKETDKIVNA